MNDSIADWELGISDCGKIKIRNPHSEIGIALLTVSAQALKVALANPVKSLQQLY